MKTQISALISKAALLLMIIGASVLMPFKVDAAAWGDAPVLGINIYAIDYDYNQVPLQTSINLDTNQTRWHCASSHSSMGCQTWVSENTDGNTTSSITGRLNTQTYHNVTATLFKYEIVFDKSYVGSIHINWSSSAVSTYFSRYLYVNGTSVEFTTNVLYESFSIDSYNLDYAPLEVIDTTKNWNFPLESYGYVSSLLKWYPDKLVSISENNYFQYPIFRLSAEDRVFRYWLDNNREYYWSFNSSLNIYDSATLLNFITLSNENISILEVKVIDYSMYSYGFSGVTVRFKANYTGSLNITLKSGCDFIPIYANRKGYPISTDLALITGLSNSLLDDISKIANGTTDSNQQSSDLSSGTDSMQDEMDDLVGIEDSYNQQFNNSVNSIDFSNPLQQNQGLLGASNFVITVFNGLIANNPFSILIIIVCILLIGKKVIGK